MPSADAPGLPCHRALAPNIRHAANDSALAAERGNCEGPLSTAVEQAPYPVPADPFGAWAVTLPAQCDCAPLQVSVGACGQRGHDRPQISDQKFKNKRQGEKTCEMKTTGQFLEAIVGEYALNGVSAGNPSAGGGLSGNTGSSAPPRARAACARSNGLIFCQVVEEDGDPENPIEPKTHPGKLRRNSDGKVIEGEIVEDQRFGFIRFRPSGGRENWYSTSQWAEFGGKTARTTRSCARRHRAASSQIDWSYAGPSQCG